MKQHYYVFLLSALLLVLTQGCKSTQIGSSNKDEISFTILQVNDVYEIAPLTGNVGGMAKVETIQKELEKENPNLITIHAGDFLSPSLIGTIKENGKRIHGEQMVDVMNAVGFDYITYGNHEFDINQEALQNRLNESNFVWTSCNTFMAEGHVPFYKEQNGKKIESPEYIIHEVKNTAGAQLKIGFIGVTIPFNKNEYVSYDDVNSSARKTYDKIKNEINIAIAITHLERNQDSLFALAMPEFSLLIGGHDHNHMDFKVGKVRITKADANARSVYVHRFKYNTRSKKSSFTSELVFLDEKVAEDPEIKKIVDKWLKKVDDILETGGYNAYEILCTTSKELDGLELHIRDHATELGYISAEAMLAQEKTADFAVINSGSIRLDDIITGDISQYDVLRTFPFGGGMTLVNLDGKTVKELFVNGMEKNRGIGGFLQTTRNVSSKDGKYLIDGKEIEETKTYKVLLPTFMASGKEANLGFLADYYSPEYETAHKIFPSGVKNDIVDLVIAYLKKYKE